MNIVDVIKSQLTGNTLGQLASLIGESEDKTKTAVGAAVPGMLSLLSNLASTSGGADKLINALKQVDPGQHGGLGDILSGGQAPQVQEKGFSLLNLLLGASALPVIINILSKFAGIAAGPAKGLLGMLAPMILSVIAKQFAGKSLTSQALSSFFTDQKSNISSAMPAGLSLADIPGFGTASHAASAAGHVARDTVQAARATSSVVKEEASGLPGWLLPLLGLLALGALAWYFLGGTPEEKPVVVNPPVVAPGKKVEVVAPKVEVVAPKVEVVAPKIEVPALDITKFSGDLGSAYTSLTEILGGVKDAPAAEASLPKLTDLVTKIDGYKTTFDKLDAAAKGTVAKVTTDHLSKFKDMAGNLLKIGGISDKFKELINALLLKLAGFAVS